MAQGVMQHHTDDAWFHGTRTFTELNLAFAVKIRESLPGDEGFRPSFLGHILVELLLDAVLAEEQPQRLDDYYAALRALDPMATETAVNRLATKPTDRIAQLIPRFAAERFLYDYLEDGRLWVRLNHIMGRVGLPPVPDSLRELFPAMRQEVRERRRDLLMPNYKNGGK